MSDATTGENDAETHKYDYYDPDDDLEEEELRGNWNANRQKYLDRLVTGRDQRLKWYYWALGFAIFFLVMCIVELILSCCALGALFWEQDDNIRDFNDENNSKRSRREDTITKKDVLTMKITITCMVIENVIQLILTSLLLYGIIHEETLLILIYLILGIVFLVLRVCYGLYKIWSFIHTGFKKYAIIFFLVMIIIIVVNIAGFYIFFKYRDEVDAWWNGWHGKQAF